MAQHQRTQMSKYAPAESNVTLFEFYLFDHYTDHNFLTIVLPKTELYS